MPLANAFLRKDQIAKEKRYDLSVGFCPNCYLVQLMKTVDPSVLFSDYVYFSSVTQSIVDHSKKTADYLIKRFNLTTKSLVLEIGSNDGVHLQFYKNQGIKILGIDPAQNIARKTNEKGIPTIADFFSEKLAVKLVSDKQVEADIVYGANVFAHVPDIVDFLKGVKKVLKKKGVAIFEFPYLKGLLENKFDTIYHEHVFYYSAIAVRNLFQYADLELVDIEEVPMQGGSLRVFASHPEKFPISSKVTRMIANEKKAGFERLETYELMNARVTKLKKELLNYLKHLKKEGKRIAGYSAPAKGNILLNFFGLRKYLDYIVDKAPAKQGLYTPGTHFLVYPPSQIDQERPDFLLILCWNIADEVMKQYTDYKQKGGKFIIPIPRVTII